MNKIAYRSLIVLVLVAVLVAGMVFFCWKYWNNGDDWVTAAGSKHVYKNSQLLSGMMLDRTGALLVENGEKRVYGPDSQLRAACVHWTGDVQGNIEPAVLNSYCDYLLDYSFLDGLYKYGKTDSRMHLTLSARLQSAALEALGDRTGTVAVMNYKTGELLCAVSTPGFDPLEPPGLTEDSQPEGLYLNRFTQSAYTPGSIFKVVTLAAALEKAPEMKNEIYICVGNYDAGAGRISCENAHGEQDLKTAFANSCNCTFAKIAQTLGPEVMLEYVNKLGFTKSVSFDGITTASGSYDITDATPTEFGWSAVGQHKDLVNPCAYLTFISAVANGGQGPMPYVVSSVTLSGKTNYAAQPRQTPRLMEEKTASELRRYMHNNVLTRYGAESFGGFSVGAKTGTAEVGEDKKPNAMLVGFVMDEATPYAFFVAVEDGGYGKDVCIPIIAQVLSSCDPAELG